MLYLGPLLCQTLPAAVGFTVTPATVSNTYSGSITLQITGLTDGQTVVVQEFLDANTNGVIDGADLLWQQFQLTDGQASIIGGITNINVPGDTDTISGQITARVMFQSGEVGLNLIGKYACKLSSPTGLFTPITNAFTVTNAAYAQSLTGNVVNNATNVPNAVVLVFRPDASSDGPGDLVAGSVANNSGAYAVKLPAGTYAAAAFKSNYLGNLFPAPVTVGSGATVIANIIVTNATHTISGKVADAANNAIGLPGLFVHGESGQWAGIAQSDTNGNFSIRVRSGHWEIGAEGLEPLGYIGAGSESNSSDTTTGNVNGLVITYPKAAALFYGRVTNNFGQPVAGVKIESENGDYFFYQSSFTDANGNYVAGALANDDWEVEVDNDQSTVTNYVFSGGLYTNLNAGQAVQHNFTALLATNRITGHLQTIGGNPITNVEVYAYATITGKSYYIETYTDDNGNYSLNVAAGDWGVGVCCSCDSWNLGYCCPNSQNVTVANANIVANFISPGQVLITNSSPLPIGYDGDWYQFQFGAATCQPAAYWSTTNPPSGLDLSSEGELSGYPDTLGSNYFYVRIEDGSGGYATKAFSLVIHPATTGGVTDYYVNKLRSYRQTNTASAFLDNSQGPYNAYLGVVQASLGLVTNATCTLPTSVVKVFPSGVGALELQVHDTFSSQSAFDAAYPAGNYSFALRTVNDGDQFPVLNLPAPVDPNAPHITNYTTAQAINPNSDFLLHWEAFSSATPDDVIRLFVMDDNAVPAFKLWWYPTPVFEDWPGSDATSSIIPAGTLQAGRTYLGLLQFIRVVDFNDVAYPGAYGVTVVSAQTAFNLTTASAVPALSQPARLSATQFRFLLNGLAGQNYTIQKSTNLSTTNWSVLFITNAPATSIQIIDPAATNSRAFYRALLGP
jgi:hypothetical protein